MRKFSPLPKPTIAPITPPVDLSPLTNELAATKAELAATKENLAQIESDLGGAIEVTNQNLGFIGGKIPAMNQALGNQNQAIIDLRQMVASTGKLVPDTSWITPVSAVVEQWYKRTIEEAITEISLEFAHPSDLLSVGTQVLTDFVTGFSDSGFWGQPVKFTNFTVGSRSIRTVIGIKDRTVTLFVMYVPGEKPACMRNIRINGKYQDLIPLEQAIVTQAANTEKLDKLRTWVTANAGIAVAVGSNINVQIPVTGNRSLQLQARTGTLTWSGNTANSVANGSVGAIVASHAMSTTWEYANSVLNMAQQNNQQTIWINDETNKQRWKVSVAIGASYNNNLFVVEQL